MWVFDGEKWIDEGGSSAQSELQQKTQDLRNWERDGFYPELQVIEITRIERREEIRGPILIP
jgi:hypothetical protein